MDSYLIPAAVGARPAGRGRAEKRIIIRPPSNSTAVKRSRTRSTNPVKTNAADTGAALIDKNVKKLFVTVFDGNKNRVNEMCAMLFGDVVETNRPLRDFLAARTCISFSERSVDFFFKRASPYSTQTFIDKFKLGQNAPRTVRVVFSADVQNSVAVVRRKIVNTPAGRTAPGTSDADVELHPHMPDSYGVYNANVKIHVVDYVVCLSTAIVDFFRRHWPGVIIVVCIRNVYWLHCDLMTRAKFTDDMFKRYNACIVYEKRKK